MTTQDPTHKCLSMTCKNQADPGMWECAACRALRRAASERATARAQQAKDLAARTRCTVASEMDPLDTAEAFRPGSPHWGSHPSPTAKVVA